MKNVKDICKSLILNDRINKWAIKRLSEEELNLLNNFYKDSESLNETIYRILNNLDIRPTCVICGKKVRYVNFRTGFTKHCSQKCTKNDPNTQLKLEETCVKKYGCKNPGASKEAQEKIKRTMLEHYGVDHAFKSKEVKDKIINTHRKKLGVDWPMQSKQVQKKSKQTCLEKYGVEYTGQSEIKKQKSKETFLKHYGVDHNWKNKECWLKTFENRFKNKIDYNGIYSSKPEQLCYDLLKTKFNDVIRQKKDENKYPFFCDFYIKDIDTWIEYNGFMTHGFHEYDPNDNKDIEKLNKLIQKDKENKTPGHNLYNSTIYNWTIKDPLKRKYAKENNLNYLEFFSVDELKTWLDNYE